MSTPKAAHTPGPFYAHQGETHHNADGNGFSFNVGGWYVWDVKGNPQPSRAHIAEAEGGQS